jgi:hypothetical protein
MATTRPKTDSIRDLIRDARNLIDRVEYGSLATVCAYNEPWNTPLHLAVDQDWHVYWCSSPDAQHSLNIRRNPCAVLVVYDSTRPDRTAAGVYLKVRAYELAAALDVQRALSCLYRRKHEPPPPVDDFLADAPRRAYEAAPTAIWTNVLVQDGPYTMDRRVMLHAGRIKTG